ncbi:MAG: response regulator transcription factor [Ignavibacteriaceae bacterium]|nr:response regulator transcription factor [Ignavibacteriaceae bacterium]
MKLLLVEDEKELASDISKYLIEEGYLIESASTYNEGREKLSLYDYDCVIIDITLPGGNGLDLIRMIKEKLLNTGIIIISAKNSLDDRIMGLETGSDDYLTKPFYLSELNARIKSILRRRNFSGNKEIIIDEIKMTLNDSQILIYDKPLSLTKKEYELLLFFAANINRVITKESIAEHLWGDSIDTTDSFDFIYTHIKNLRKKILDLGGKDHIQTIYGMGYKFIIL